jgi:DNA invertase Pin-like site-specific DNA recombinase
MAPRRAIGIVRVSQVKGRGGESFASPAEQRERIQAACERDDLLLLEVLEELDISGGAPLDKRWALRRAVEAVEAGAVEVVVAAYFDRLVRSLLVQNEVVSRVERAGGQVLAVDAGRITNDSAGQWLSGTMLGAVSEYQRRTTVERSAEAQARAVARGVAPWPNVTAGYVRAEADDPRRGIVKGQFVPDRQTQHIVADALTMRADGATVTEVRSFLAANGINLSYHGVLTLLSSRVLRGEIHFGKLVNLKAHEPIVDAETWRRVQGVRIPRGRKAKSDRLLARLAVLRCHSCGARMVVGTAHHGEYALYRCPPTGDCERRVTISAELVEGVVTGAVRAAIADAEGRASAETNIRDAERALTKAQADLDAAIRAFVGLEDEAAARERLTELRESRDEAQQRLDQRGGMVATVTINAATDWDRLSLDARRALIRATVERVTVSPGRGADRVSIDLFTE